MLALHYFTTFKTPSKTFLRRGHNGPRQVLSSAVGPSAEVATANPGRDPSAPAVSTILPRTPDTPLIKWQAGTVEVGPTQ